MSRIYINPVEASINKKSFPKLIFYKPKSLLKALRGKGLDVSLGCSLKSGTVSQVYEGLVDNKKIIIKHTENSIPFDPTEIFISREGHNIDSYILKLLQKSKKIRVPKIIYHFPKITTTIMEDVRESGFKLLFDNLIEGVLNNQWAENIGKTFAFLIQETKNWKFFITNESAEESIYERGLELRLAYPNSQKEYLALEKEFVRGKHFVWPDSHPKNIFINDNGKIIFIDFGRSHWGDQRYMLPNFLSHIVIYSLAGYYSRKKALEFIQRTIKSYKETEIINEEIFCKYLGMEILHRANGKWLGGINRVNQKVALCKFGLKIFDENIITIKQLLALLN